MFFQLAVSPHWHWLHYVAMSLLQKKSNGYAGLPEWRLVAISEQVQRYYSSTHTISCTHVTKQQRVSCKAGVATLLNQPTQWDLLLLCGGAGQHDILCLGWGRGCDGDVRLFQVLSLCDTLVTRCGSSDMLCLQTGPKRRQDMCSIKRVNEEQINKKNTLGEKQLTRTKTSGTP